MLQILIVVVCVVISCFLIKKEAPAFVSVITGYINVLINNIDIEKGYIKIVMKITGLSIATQFVSDICRDNGFNAMASQLELMCRISIVMLGMPVIIALLEMVNRCLK